MSVVVAHDYLTQRGGAERVALVLADEMNAREIVTSAFVPEQTFEEFSSYKVRDSDHAIVRTLRKDPRRALLFLARAWDTMAPVEADVLLCSSSGWSHALRTAPGTRKIVYCHNPARWLYQRDDFLEGQGILPRLALKSVSRHLKFWDQKAASTADAYVVNSSVVAARVRRVYGISPQIIFPPVSVDVNGEQSVDPLLVPGFFLSVGRARGYKGVEKLAEAFASMPEQRLAIVGMAPADWLPSNVVALGRVSEARLRWLYANARGLMSVSREDFGLTPIEANAFGTPALVLKAGGFLDSTQPGVSGEFIPDDEVESIIVAVREFRSDWQTSNIIEHAEKFSIASFTRRLNSVIEEIK